MNNKALEYDYIVIGAGSGGVSSAHIARTVYKKTVLIVELDVEKVGGTCVNVGCVPKKIMWNVASILEDLKTSKEYGITSRISLDYKTLVENREKHISTINQGYLDYFKDEGINLLFGCASFIDDHIISVGEKYYTSRHILIATGSKNYVPDVPGKEHIGTSDDFFKLKSTPKNVLILGNGYIAAELAGLLCSFGVNTTIAIRSDKFCRNFDTDLGNILYEIYEKAGIKFLMETEVESVSKLQSKGDLLEVKFSTGKVELYNLVISAIGRVGNIVNLSLGKTSVVCKNNFIPSDKYENTNVPGIYAIGDVTGKVQLTPVATSAGSKLAHRLFGERPKYHLDYSCIPTVMFSHPPIGTIGLSEADARVLYSDVKIYKTRFTSMYYSLSLDHQVPTFFKLICVGPDEKVVGLHAIGRGVDEMMQGFAIAMKIGATKFDFDNTICIHPTSSEEFCSLE